MNNNVVLSFQVWTEDLLQYLFYIGFDYRAIVVLQAIQK